MKNTARRYRRRTGLWIGAGLLVVGLLVVSRFVWRVEVQGTVVSVTDSGPGAPDFALPHLGEKFFSTVRPDGVSKGSGLGLAIVRQIMALHGGRIVVRNTEPGLRVELHFG